MTTNPTATVSNPTPYDLIGVLGTDEYVPQWERPTQMTEGAVPMPDVSMLNAAQAVGFGKFIQFINGSLTRKNPATGQDLPVDWLVLEGVAGTGKSFLNAKVVQWLVHKNPRIKIGVLTPTHQAGAAAKKLSSLATLEQVKFATIHSVAGVRKVNDQETGRETFPPIKEPKFEDFDVIFFDEAGMVAEELFILCRMYAHKVKMIWTGDPKQLPPVGETISKAYDTSLDFWDDQVGQPVTTDRILLTEPMRAALDHPITSLATAIRNRQVQPKNARSFMTPEGFRAIYTAPKEREMGPDEQLDDLLVALYDSDHYKKDSDFCTLLAYTNKQVGAWNRRIRRLLYKRRNRLHGHVDPPVLFEREYIKLVAAYVIPSEDDDEGFFDATNDDRGQQIYANNEVLRVVSWEPYTMTIPGTGDQVPALMCTLEKRFPLGGWVERAEVPVVLSSAMEWYNKCMWKLWSLVKNGRSDLKSAYWDLKNYGPAQARYAYASTVHKRQGCTDFINLVDSSNIRSCQYWPKTTPQEVRTDQFWRMLYTAATRAKKGIVYLT